MVEEPLVFTREELLGASRNWSRWAGGSNYRTKQCDDDCRFKSFREGEDGKTIDTCEWGATWKRLVVRKGGPKSCTLLGQSSPREEEILNRRRLEQARNRRVLETRA